MTVKTNQMVTNMLVKISKRQEALGANVELVRTGANTFTIDKTVVKLGRIGEKALQGEGTKVRLGEREVGRTRAFGAKNKAGKQRDVPRSKQKDQSNIDYTKNKMTSVGKTFKSEADWFDNAKGLVTEIFKEEFLSGLKKHIKRQLETKK